jgi:hypothetical protein
LISFLGGLGVLAVFLSGVRAAEFAHVSRTQDASHGALLGGGCLQHPNRTRDNDERRMSDRHGDGPATERRERFDAERPPS